MSRYSCVILLGLALAGGTALGCSNPTVSGTATGQPAAASSTATAFDPCTDLSAVDISSYGLDPNTKRDLTSSIGNLAHGCGWGNQDFLFAITAGGGSLDALKSSTHYFSVTPIQVLGQDAARVVVAPDVGDCHIGIQSGPDVIDIGITLIYKAPEAADNSCTLVTDLASKVVTKIPR